MAQCSVHESPVHLRTKTVVEDEGPKYALHSLYKNHDKKEGPLYLKIPCKELFTVYVQDSCLCHDRVRGFDMTGLELLRLPYGMLKNAPRLQEHKQKDVLAFWREGLEESGVYISDE